MDSYSVHDGNKSELQQMTGKQDCDAMRKSAILPLVFIFGLGLCYINLSLLYPGTQHVWRDTEAPGVTDLHVILDAKSYISYRLPDKLYHYTMSPQNSSCDAALASFWNTEVVENAVELNVNSSCIKMFPKTEYEVMKIPEFSDIFTEKNFQNMTCHERRAYFSRWSRPPVALASFQGSGNTWVRHLLEQMSGILTGSIYCGVVREVFYGECLKDTSHLLTVKTHKPANRTWFYDFVRAVLIIRNPFDAIVAEYNRIYAGKVGLVKRRAFKTKTWNKFVEVHASFWFKHVFSWLTEYGKPLHILMYERLQTNFYQELFKLARFLNLKPTYGDLWCVQQLKEGDYHRQRVPWEDNMKLYSPNQKKLLGGMIQHIQRNLELFYNETLPFIERIQP